ncbi:MAG: serine/threonine protein kinase [Rhodothermales bacterium]|jgi:serine/threonine protein kinase
MGVVYRAEDTKLNRTVALKLLAPHMLASDSDRSRFYREARVAAALHHPNIATVFEIDETHDGRPFIAMEYIDGHQLDEGLSEKPLPVEDAVRIARRYGRQAVFFIGRDDLIASKVAAAGPQDLEDLRVLRASGYGSGQDAE